MAIDDSLAANLTTDKFGLNSTIGTDDFQSLDDMLMVNEEVISGYFMESQTITSSKSHASTASVILGSFSLSSEEFNAQNAVINLFARIRNASSSIKGYIYVTPSFNKSTQYGNLLADSTAIIAFEGKPASSSTSSGYSSSYWSQKSVNVQLDTTYYIHFVASSAGTCYCYGVTLRKGCLSYTYGSLSTTQLDIPKTDSYYLYIDANISDDDHSANSGSISVTINGDKYSAQAGKEIGIYLASLPAGKVNLSIDNNLYDQYDWTFTGTVYLTTVKREQIRHLRNGLKRIMHISDSNTLPKPVNWDKCFIIPINGSGMPNFKTLNLLTAAGKYEIVEYY